MSREHDRLSRPAAPGSPGGPPASRWQSRDSPGTCGQIGLVRRSVADLLADEDDMDASGQFGVDLQNLPDLAVLPVGGLRAGVFQRQAVLVDPLVRGL